MRIDELARRTGVPTRTIRYYTQQALLPPPTLRGRVGYYSDVHVDRIRLIKELQEKRYLPLSVIRQVLRGYESGVDIEAMLAPLDLVFGDGRAQPRETLARPQLAAAAGVDPSVVDAAEEMGLLFPRGTGPARRYSTDDVHMLSIAEDWLRQGLPNELGRLYRDALEEIAERQVEAFHELVVEPAAQKDLAPDEMRDALVDGYNEMSRTFHRLFSLLHRKALQQAVERYAAALEHGAATRDGATNRSRRGASARPAPRG